MPISPVPPRYATPRDPAAATYGGAVGRLARALGMPLMPWQQQVVDTALEVGPDGLLRYATVVVTVPRQAGKSSLVRPLMIWRCLSMPRARCWLTAQLREDARDQWLELVELVESSALARALTVRRTNGSETARFANGSTIRLFNPGSESALHGKVTDQVGIDESWAFSAEQGRQLTQAVTPTQATRPEGQVWVYSTAGTARSTWFRAMVDAGRKAAGPSRSAYFEWSIPEDTEDLTDLDVYAAHHPALGHTITRRALESAQERMTAAEFARAYGNFWTGGQRFVIEPSLWDAARSAVPISGRITLAVETAPDRSSSAIVAAGNDGAGWVCELIDHRDGAGWVADRTAELVARWQPLAVVIDPYGPARTVLADLTGRPGFPAHLLREVSAADYVAAHAAFVDGLVSRTVRVRPHAALDAALAAASTRTVREQECLSRAQGPDGTAPAPLIAAQLACWAAQHARDEAPWVG